MQFTPDVIITIIGFIIFVPSFAFQLFRIYKKGKHTFNFSPISWTLNFTGRFLWIAYGLFFGMQLKMNGNDTGMAILTVVGQGLTTLMTVPILYYSYRNNKNKGEYAKEHFQRKLFLIRLSLVVLTIAICVVSILGIEGVYKQVNIGHGALLIFALSCSVFTSVAFLPQTLRTIKNRKTNSTSFWLSFLFATGNTLLVFAFFLKILNWDGGLWHVARPSESVWGPLQDYIGIIILPVPTIILMFWVAFIKFSNHRKHGEAL